MPALLTQFKRTTSQMALCYKTSEAIPVRKTRLTGDLFTVCLTYCLGTAGIGFSPTTQ